MESYAIISRRLRKTALWKDPVLLQHYIDLCIHASTKERDVRQGVFAVHLQRGQLAVTRIMLAKTWGITAAQVRAQLAAMKREGLLDIQPVGKRYTLLSVLPRSENNQTNAQPPAANGLERSGLASPKSKNTPSRAPTKAPSNIKEVNIEEILLLKEETSKEEKDFTDGLWN